MLTIVYSLAENSNARLAIRETWGKLAIERGGYVFFLIGDPENDQLQLSIEEEDTQFDDLLQGSFPGITLKLKKRFFFNLNIIYYNYF